MKDGLKNILLLVASSLVAIVLLEGGLRILNRPQTAAADPQDVESIDGKSPFLYGDPARYEPRPKTPLRLRVSDAAIPVLETLNSEGFRGPDVAAPKLPATFRILALGDSVVQAFAVSEANTWERVLERQVQQKLPARGIARCEVLNSGVGGYVSWQALARLKSRGLKFQPDVVVLLVGWNDFGYGTRADWRPGMDLSQIEEAYAKKAPSGDANPRPMDSLYRYSRVALAIRNFRNAWWNSRRTSALLEQKRNSSGIAFNQKALDDYLTNLTAIESTCREHGIPLAIVLFPALPTPEIGSDPVVMKKMQVLLQNLPIGVPDFLEGQRRYLQAIREFGAARPGVVTLVDAFAAFQKLTREERLAAFTDQVHLTRQGNQLLAESVWRALDSARILPQP